MKFILIRRLHFTGHLSTESFETFIPFFFVITFLTIINIIIITIIIIISLQKHCMKCSVQRKPV